MLLSLLAFLLAGCSTNPITGRKQLNFIPDMQINSLAANQYSQMLQKAPVNQNPAETAMVRRVGKRLQAATEAYFREIKRPDVLKGFQWEVNVINSDQMNAFAMPGGKIAFYSGILPVCANEAGVAAVMGHEVAHALARHGSERMSHGVLAQVGAVAVNEATKDKSASTRQTAMLAYNLGAQFGAIMPYSRKHEAEADSMGLILMAKAGYDPNEAWRLWERMKKKGGKQPPEFLSTHPSHDSRIQNIKAQIPKVMPIYNKAIGRSNR